MASEFAGALAVPTTASDSLLVPLGAQSRLWRIVAIASLRSSWVLQRVRFFADEGCTEDITSYGEAGASGSTEDTLAANAFAPDASVWNAGCGSECCGAFVSVRFDEPRSVRCMLVDFPAGSNRGSEAPMAVQLRRDGGRWQNVATLPPEGGALRTWDPTAVGAVCQGWCPVNPELRGGGSLYMITSNGVRGKHWIVEEFEAYSDAGCSRQVTHMGIPVESVWWGGKWKPQHAPTNASEAFDGRKSTVWEAESEMHNFFTGGNGEDNPSLGLVLPEGADIQCLSVQSPVQVPLRLLRCSGDAWDGVDDCECIGSWSDTSGPLRIGDPSLLSSGDFRALCLLAVVAAALALAAAGPRLAEQAEKLASVVGAFLRGGSSRLVTCGFTDADTLPLMQQAGSSSSSVAEDAMPALIHGKDLAETPPMHELFQRQANAAPAAPCLRLGGGAPDVSYGVVARRAHALAERLQAVLPKQSVVGLLLDRQPSMIVAILAVLEADCVWVPLDERAPTERLTSILRDADAALLLADAGSSWDLGVPCGTLAADGSLCSLPQPREERAAPPPPPDTACLYYTSGSTGEPKAVIMDQRFFVVNARWYVDAFGLAPGSVVAAKARFIWATSLWEILPPLISGATLLLLPKLKTEEVARRLADGGATHICGVPSELELVMDSTLELRHLICMGERLHPSIASNLSRVMPRGCTLWNAYAATESPVALWRVTASAAHVFAGRPLAGAFIGVLDDSGKLASAGDVGEIVMGGVIPRCGYWRRPDLTEERFSMSCVGRTFRSGDIGRIVVDEEAGGLLQLEVTGRRDRQVKIRGQRVELGEVEACAAQIAAERGGAAAAVAADSGDDQQHLFLFAAPAGALGAEGLREAMSSKLPSYMLPDVHRVTLLAELPRLLNGKVNYLELRGIAAKMLADESHQSLDSLGLARLYSQQQLAAKNSIDTASGVFLLGMMLFHSGWWTWGTSFSGTCVACSPKWLERLLQALFTNESCLYGFLCGGALMATTQADCHTWSTRDLATLIIFLFAYCPWTFLSRAIRLVFPGLTVECNCMYHRWYLLAILEAKALLVLTRRRKWSPVCVTLALCAAVVLFPARGYYDLAYFDPAMEEICAAPTGVGTFLVCSFFPGNSGMFASRKWTIATTMYYAVVHFGPPAILAAGRRHGRPQRVCYQAASSAMAFLLALLLGLWFAGFVYPLQGYETVEWPDTVAIGNSASIDSRQAVMLLVIEVLVPMAQAGLIMLTVFYAPGAKWKGTTARWISSTMLGTYLVAASLKYTEWTTDAVIWVCSCQCSDLAGVGQFLAALLVNGLVTFTFGLAYQAMLLRGVVPGVLGAAALLSKRMGSVMTSRNWSHEAPKTLDSDSTVSGDANSTLSAESERAL